MWKFFPEAAGFTKEENCKRVKQQLLNLKERIPEIKFMEVGINSNRSEHAFDLVLYSEFENFTDLEVYQRHSAHIEFKEFIKDLRSQ